MIQILNYVQTEVYTINGGTTHIRAQLVADTANELPAPTGLQGFTLEQGSTAVIVTTAERYMLSGSGTWYLQQTANLSSIVSDISQIQTTLLSVGSDATYAKYSIDTYFMPAVKKLINDGAKNRLNLAAAQTVTDNGITFTVNTDMSIHMDGSTTGTAWIHVPVTIKAGTYKFTGMQEAGGSTGAYRLEFRTTPTSGVLAVCDSTDGTDVTFNNDTNCYFNVRVNNMSFPVDIGKTVYPMLCNPDLYRMTSEYRPYAPTNRELFLMQ